MTPEGQITMPSRILVIEDNPPSLELMTYLLKAFGYTVVSALDGQEGLELARRELLDLIICDIHLPTLDGYEVARTLRAERPDAEIVVLDNLCNSNRSTLDRVTGVTVYVDRFGNFLTNLPGEEIMQRGGKPRVKVGRRELSLVTTFQGVGEGEPLAYIGSTGLVEIAVNGGSARQVLKLKLDQAVEVVW